MQQTASRLKVLFWATITIALVAVVLFETECLLPGEWATDKTGEYFAAVGMELYALLAVPLALGLFRIQTVRRRLVDGKENALLPWGVLRIVILGVAMVVAVVLYYMFLNASFGYIAIILLISMVFVYPSFERCVSETTAPKKD